MIKKQVLNFSIFSVVILAIDLLLYFVNHGNISSEELMKVLKLLIMTGVVVIPLLVYIEKKKKQQDSD